MRGKIAFSVLVLGFTSIITQIIIFREFLTIFNGNELVLGILLSLWLLLAGIGAYIGRYFRPKRISVLQAIIGFLPLLSLIFVRVLTQLFPSGVLLGIAHISLISFLVLLPYCILNGFLIVLFTQAYPKDAVGKVYQFDVIGSAIGGVLLTFILIFFLQPFHIALFLLFLNLFTAFLLSRSGKYIIAAIFFLSLTLLFVRFDHITAKMIYPGQEIVKIEYSQYGKLVVTESGEQINYYYNGLPLYSSEDVIEKEKKVHFAMVQHHDPKKILVIGGGYSGTLDEILKYRVDRIDYVELDPILAETLESDNIINIVSMDAKRFIRRSDERYDVVIIDLPDPSTAQINAYYTLEFYQSLKNNLNADSVVSLKLSSNPNYISRESRQLLSSVYNTLKKEFANVIIIPSSDNYFIASDSGLTYDIPEKIAEKSIETVYVNEDYLKGEITDERIDYVKSMINPDTRINTDFKPEAYLYQLLHWLSFYKINYIFFLAVILILTGVFIFRQDALGYAIFSSGFSASSIEVMLFIAFQIIYGYIYQMLGVIITLFMVGLGLGAYISTKKKWGINELISFDALIILYSLLLPFMFLAIRNIKYSYLVFLFLTLSISFLVGLEFPLAARLYRKKKAETASHLHNSDMIGSAVGAFFVSALLIPLLGIVSVCFLVAVMNIISTSILYFNRNSFK